MPVLGLHPGAELDVAMLDEGAVRAGQEGLDQRAGLRAHGHQEALPGCRGGG